MDAIIDSLRTEARTFDRVVHRCDSSLVFMDQRNDWTYQRTEIDRTRTEAVVSAKIIREAISLLKEVE